MRVVVAQLPNARRLGGLTIGLQAGWQAGRPALLQLKQQRQDTAA